MGSCGVWWRSGEAKSPKRLVKRVIEEFLVFLSEGGREEREESRG